MELTLSADQAQALWILCAAPVVAGTAWVTWRYGRAAATAVWAALVGAALILMASLLRDADCPQCESALTIGTEQCGGCGASLRWEGPHPRVRD